MCQPEWKKRERERERDGLESSTRCPEEEWESLLVPHPERDHPFFECFFWGLILDFPDLMPHVMFYIVGLDKVMKALLYLVPLFIE